MEIEERLLLIEQRLDKLERRRKVSAVKTDEKTVSVAAHFKESFKHNRGYDYPRWGAKENAILKAMGNGIPEHVLKAYINLYLNWKDPYIIKAGHPVALFAANIERLVAEAQKGMELMAESSKAKMNRQVIEKELNSMHELGAHDAARQAKNTAITRQLEGSLENTPTDQVSQHLVRLFELDF